MLIGCKKDLVDSNKAGYMQIDTQVKNALKALGDIEHLIQYAQSGYDNAGTHENEKSTSQRQVVLNKEDATMFMQKLYLTDNTSEDVIQLFQTQDEQTSANNDAEEDQKAAATSPGVFSYVKGFFVSTKNEDILPK